MEKTINIKINNNQFPKLFEIDDNRLNDNILYLLNIGYQSVYSNVLENNIINNFKNIWFREQCYKKCHN